MLCIGVGCVRCCDGLVRVVVGSGGLIVSCCCLVVGGVVGCVCGCF